MQRRLIANFACNVQVKFILFIVIYLDCNIGEVTTNGKRQKWNFCRLSSALCTVYSKYLYLLWIVRDTFLLLCNLVPRGPFCHELEIRTPGQVQWHSGFEWLCKHNRLRSEPIRFVRLDSGHGQSDGKSVNHRLPVLNLARGRDPSHWPKGSQPLGTRLIFVGFI